MIKISLIHFFVLLLFVNKSFQNELISRIISNPCQSFNCKNGVCFLTSKNQPMCKCPPEFSGKFCQIPKNICTIDEPCKNQGKCIINQFYTEFRCECPNGFTGKYCETPVDVQSPIINQESELLLIVLICLSFVLFFILFRVIREKKEEEKEKVRKVCISTISNEICKLDKV